MPSKFLPTQVYSPASLSVTWRTSNRPLRLLKGGLFARTHVIVGMGFPLTEHWNTALWFSMTVWFIGEITTMGGEMDSPVSPFTPGSPLRPGTPWTPFSPFRPCDPVIPCFPCFPGSPRSPRGPFLPVARRAPLLPREHLAPCTPGGPCTQICCLGEQNDRDVRELLKCLVYFTSDWLHSKLVWFCTSFRWKPAGSSGMSCQ